MRGYGDRMVNFCLASCGRIPPVDATILQAGAAKSIGPTLTCASGELERNVLMVGTILLIFIQNRRVIQRACKPCRLWDL